MDEMKDQEGRSGSVVEQEEVEVQEVVGWTR